MMRTKNTLLLSVILFFLHAAGLAQDKNNTGLPPVETKAKNSDYKPAFSGQTRVAGAKTTTPYNVEKITEKLGSPFAIVAMPDGRLMVTIKSGYMDILDAGGKLVKKITGLPDVVTGGQGGLLDVAFDPNFASNKIMYWSYSEKYEQGNITAVAKGQLNDLGIGIFFGAYPKVAPSRFHGGL
jgi:aldose sugar dehydrogenase